MCKNQDLLGGQNVGHERCKGKVPSKLRARGWGSISLGKTVQASQERLVNVQLWWALSSCSISGFLKEGTVFQKHSGPSYHLGLCLPTGRAMSYLTVEFRKKTGGCWDPRSLLGSLWTHSLPLLLCCKASTTGSHCWGSMSSQGTTTPRLCSELTVAGYQLPIQTSILLFILLPEYQFWGWAY